MSEESIFRKKAKDAYFKRLDGKVIINTHLSHWWVTLLIALIVTSVMLFISFGSYSPKAQATGYLLPENGLSEVYSTSNGYLSEVYIEEGQLVKKGQPLATISYERYVETGEASSHQLRALTKQMMTTLNHQIQTTNDIYQSKMSLIDNRKNIQASTISHNSSRLKNINNKIRIENKKYNKLNTLYKDNYISEDVLLQQEVLLSTLNIERDDQLSLLDIAKQELLALSVEHELLERQRKTEIASLEQKIDQLEHSEIESLSSKGETLIAKVSGRVRSVAVRPGERIELDTLAMTIVPEESELHVEMQVSSNSLKMVEVGQEVQVKLSAFPYQKYGTLTGVVSYIADTASVDKDSTKAASYRLLVSLPQQSIVDGSIRHDLTVGMQAIIDIKGKSMPIMTWLLEPIRYAKEQFEI
ncbi:HlyD family efflux transporter periplasmic adaptor subunit [Vibrio sp. S9_S30]|uniref:HlyD family secretion protein n=1 Tax=Vibrio sp. S9_S30 TaxID=2720226 RepID=UPI00168087B3|nr:HlyD family efflux transporter periplasmic adaptor subunit [Vibrio sp. S9_S30]MBD1558533.1 HlyD family efflux transporter periplasmic adaptor subunit [Vibrio sp. S9_S30]